MGVVVIGRNEGQRLERCLASLVGAAQQIVYVDSGSSDGSVQMARALGVAVVELDMTIAFTAARARKRRHQRVGISSTAHRAAELLRSTHALIQLNEAEALKAYISAG